MDSGRSCGPQLGLEMPKLIALRQIVSSEEAWRGAQVGISWITRSSAGGSPKPGLTFGDSGLDFTSTLRLRRRPSRVRN